MNQISKFKRENNKRHMKNSLDFEFAIAIFLVLILILFEIVILLISI